MTRMSLAERRQKLIAAALEVIGEQGMAAATTRAIAAAAGMPLASFHYAFESHQVLMVEAFSHLTRQERDQAVDLQGGSRAEVVREVLDAHLEALRDRRREYQACAELADHLLRTPGQEAVAAQWHHDRVADLTEALQGRVAAGVGLGSERPEALAEMLVTVQDGLTQTVALTGEIEAAQTSVDLLVACH